MEQVLHSDFLTAFLQLSTKEFEIAMKQGFRDEGQ